MIHCKLVLECLFFNVHNRELLILLRSLLFKMSSNGLWPVTMVRFEHSTTNNLALSNAHVTAKSSPSVGGYQVSAIDINRDPVSTNP